MSESVLETTYNDDLRTEKTNTGAASYYQHHQYNNSGITEIEEDNSSELFEINNGGIHLISIKEETDGSVFSLDVHGEDDCVYVAVGKSESSMDALSWTLRNLVKQKTTVFLVHIFPEIHQIPSPLGKLPKSQVSPEQMEIYMAQESGKRRDLLQKFLNMCSASKVKVETVLIESDTVAKAILDLIPILNMRKLVLGTTKSGLRKLRSRRGNGIANQILQDAPEFCEIKIICDGKEVDDQMIVSPSPSLPHKNGSESESKDQTGCFCFISSPRKI